MKKRKDNFKYEGEIFDINTISNEEVSQLCESICRNYEEIETLTEALVAYKNEDGSEETVGTEVLLGANGYGNTPRRPVNKYTEQLRGVVSNEDVFDGDPEHGMNKFEGIFKDETIDLDSGSIEMTGIVPSIAASIFGSNFEEKN